MWFNLLWLDVPRTLAWDDGGPLTIVTIPCDQSLKPGGEIWTLHYYNICLLYLVANLCTTLYTQFA